MFLTRLRRALHRSALTVLLCLTAGALSAQERIIVEAGKGLYLPHIGQVETVFVADTAIADVTSSPGEAVFLFGKAVGETTLIATDLSGSESYNYTVSVILNLQDTARSLNRRFKGENITLEATRGSVLVSGKVSNDRVRQDILATLQGSIQGVTILDRMTATESNLIRLDVALYEVNRSEVENHGVNWRSLIANTLTLNGTGVVNALNLLVANGVAAVVTETSMTTVSGRSANFAVGGEVPVPTFAGGTDGSVNNFSVDFKFVGMNLDFEPRRINDEQLRLDISSTITSPQGSSSTINGNSFPTLSSRSFDTTVELAHAHSFVIAGLSKAETFSSLTDNNPNNPVGAVARSIFSNDRESQQRQELIIVVTPRFRNLTDPMVSEQLTRPVSNLEHILAGRGAGSKGKQGRTRLVGNAGFEY